jgi:hypothetical protein
MDNNYTATFAAKWPEGVASRGFAPIPKCLITCMSDLGLKAQEAVVLFNIIERCWKAGDKAWPSVGYLATNIGRKDSATRAITSSLAKKGFLSKEQRYNDTNLYDLEPLAEKLAVHMSRCRHTAKKSEGYSQKSGGRDSQKTSDYIEPVTKTNLDPLYSHIVTNNNDDDTDIEIINRKNILHPCETDSGRFKHDWDEPFDSYKGLNNLGEQVIWRYRKCKRCVEMFHTKANPKDYRWEDGKLININDYNKMETV